MSSVPNSLIMLQKRHSEKMNDLTSLIHLSTGLHKIRTTTSRVICNINCIIFFTPTEVIPILSLPIPTNASKSKWLVLHPEGSHRVSSVEGYVCFPILVQIYVEDQAQEGSGQATTAADPPYRPHSTLLHPAPSLLPYHPTWVGGSTMVL